MTVAENLTPQQLQAVTDRGGRLLVSAAAGSGKTKVLVDRLLGYLTDPIHPKDIDSFLIITFTKAAAAELRGKIATALSKKVAEDPQNVRLQRQLQRLYMTQISTVHAFCADLLRQYAYRLDIQGDFRVAEENEIAQLRQSVMEQVLNSAYDHANEDADFRAFVDTQGLSRSDGRLLELLLGVYDSAMCHLSPVQWLDGCVEAFQVEDASAAEQTQWGKMLMEAFYSKIDRYGKIMQRCADMALSIPGEQKAAALLQENADAVKKCSGLDTWDAIVNGANFSFGTLRFTSKCQDAALADQIKALRNACKDAVADAFAPFQDHSDQVIKDLIESSAAVRGMVSLVKAFSKAFAIEKKRRGILDFADLEHKTLDLLVGKDRTAPTTLAYEIGGRYTEVMVDEYQDSNAVQDRIYMALTHQRKNCFMVGDVKQSIYQFRLADPGIFLDKYNEYADAEFAQAEEGRRVVLSKNFRSAGDVLDAVNCVFRTCMSPKVGGLHYGEREALYEGLPHTALGECAVELQAIPVAEQTYPEEAAVVAHRIKELLDGSHFVRDKENGLRTIVPEDIVILLRSPKSVANYYVEALEQLGVPCTSGSGDDLLQSRGVSLLRAMLQVVQNPRLDIPLANVLMSPLFAFSADDMACIRAENPLGSLYEAVINSTSAKANSFKAILHKLREEMKLSSLSVLIEKIMEYTHIDSIFAAMHDGEISVDHLNTFYLYAVKWEQSGQGSLNRFLEHLDSLEEKGTGISVTNQNMGAVTIMSIHKSKGLEFPVVFLCGLSRSFNMESAQKQVLCHKELGIGISAADQARRVRYPTIAKRVLAERIEADALSEEMRVLYVAMTRARDRLIMTYASKFLQKRLQRLVLLENTGCRELAVEQAGCPGDWVLLAALQQTQAAQLFALGGPCVSAEFAQMPWNISVQAASNVCEAQIPAQQERADALDVASMRDILQFRYPYAPWVNVPSKLTATELKTAKGDGATPRAYTKREGGQRRVAGKDLGTAVHALMQYLDFSRCDCVDRIRTQAIELVDQGLIPAEMIGDMDFERIHRFFCTPIGKRLQHSENVIREFQFSLLMDASIYGEGLEGEQILLQGVVDCAIIENDGITVIDFKTDHITDDNLDWLVQKYRPQLLAYASALERIFEKKIQGAQLYFFENGYSIDIM